MEDAAYKYKNESLYSSRELVVTQPIDVTADYGEATHYKILYMTRVYLWNPATKFGIPYSFAIKKVENFDELPNEQKQYKLDEARNECRNRYNMVVDFLQTHPEFTQTEIDAYLMGRGFVKNEVWW